MHVHLAGNGKPQKKQRDNTKLVNLLFSNPLTANIAYRMVKNYARIELNSGVFSATAWGCDLTYDYVKINGDYRT